MYDLDGKYWLYWTLILKLPVIFVCSNICFKFMVLSIQFKSGVHYNTQENPKRIIKYLTHLYTSRLICLLPNKIFKFCHRIYFPYSKKVSVG